jgi:glutathione S-transferase
MITLCGFAMSNYYNKVKLVLLEKGIPFTEELAMTGSTDEALLKDSPLAKVPFIRTEHGGMSESAAICEYLEDLCPSPAMLPADTWQRAKVRELITYLELHLELVARELYAEAFFGGKVSDATKERVAKQLRKNIAAFKRLAKFSPYIAGDTFTLADCAAYTSLSLVALSTQTALGTDLLAEAGVDWKTHMKLVGQRPSFQRVAADRKEAMERRAAQAAAAKA